jgi:hypothetical protein
MLNDLVTAILTTFLSTVVFVLIAKYVWDRYLSQSSRITVQVCALQQAKCKAEILALIKQANESSTKSFDCHKQRLDEEDLYVESTRYVMRAVLITLMLICNKLDISCDALNKAMIDNDILQ